MSKKISMSVWSNLARVRFGRELLFVMRSEDEKYLGGFSSASLRKGMAAHERGDAWLHHACTTLSDYCV